MRWKPLSKKKKASIMMKNKDIKLKKIEIFCEKKINQ